MSGFSDYLKNNYGTVKENNDFSSFLASNYGGAKSSAPVETPLKEPVSPNYIPEVKSNLNRTQQQLNAGLFYEPSEKETQARNALSNVVSKAAEPFNILGSLFKAQTESRAKAMGQVASKDSDYEHVQGAPLVASLGFNPLAGKAQREIDQELKDNQKLEEERKIENAKLDAEDISEVLYSGKDFKITRDKLNRWLDPNYKLSTTEKKQAREYYWANYLPVLGEEFNFFDKDAQQKNVVKGAELQALLPKFSGLGSAAHGFIGGVPGGEKLLDTLGDVTDKIYGTDTQELRDSAIQTSKDSKYYGAGKAASKIMQYYLLNKSGLLSPITDAIGGWLSPRLATALASGANGLKLSENAISAALSFGETLGNSIAGITADEIADIVLDTLPEMTENIRAGMSAEEVKNAMLVNLGVNALYNVGGELLSNAKPISEASKKAAGAVTDKTREIAAAIKAKFGDRISQETAEAIAKNRDVIAENIAKNLDDATDAVKQADELPVTKPNLPETDTIAKQTENLTPEVEPALKGQNNVQMTIDDLIDSTVPTAKTSVPEAFEDVVKDIKKDTSFGESISDVRRSFNGKVNYLKDGQNEYATAFKSALNTFQKSPTPRNYEELLKSFDEYVANAGTRWMKNWRGDWYIKEFDGSGLRKNLEQIGEKYNLNQSARIAANSVDDATDVVKDLPEIKPVEPVQPREIKNLEANGPMRERGMSQHIRSQEDVRVATPMKMEGVSNEVAAAFVDDPAMYKILQNSDTKALAEEIYNSGDETIKIGDKVYSGDVETKFRTLLDEKKPAALPLGHQLAKDYSAAGNHEMAAQIYRDLGQALTESGQFSQAAVINMMKNDPLTAMQYIEKQMDALNKEGLQRFGKKWKDVSLTPDEIKAFSEIAPGDEEALKALYDQIGVRLGKEVPTKFMDKLLEGRKISMLFNLRTMVRNFGANVPTLGLRWMADRVEALGQNIAHLINPNFKVTQSVIGSGIQGRKLATEAYNSAKVKALREGTTGKYEIPNLKNALMKDLQMYKGTAVEKWIDKITAGGINKVAEVLNNANILKNNVHIEGGIQALNKKLYGKEGVQSILESIRNTTYKLLELGDDPFIKENFVERLGSYIKAQGIKNLDDIPDEAIQTAWEEAMKATYKDNSWAVKMLRGIKGGLESIPVVGRPLSQAAIPFLQAPGNIAARMVDYSPIRGIKGIVDIISGARKGEQELVRKGIEEAAKGLTGSGLILLGMKLRESGIITGDYSDDKDQKNFQKQNGFKPWALHVGNKYYTYDWAQPFAQNLIVGTLVQDAIEKSDEADNEVLKYLGVAYKGTKAAVNSWFNESPLQGLSELMKGNYGDEADIAQNLINVGVEDFAGAFVPASINATAKATDTTQRNFYDPSSTVNTFVNQQAAKLPGASETLPAKYDTWGEEVKTAENVGEGFAQKFLIPGDYGTEKKDPVNDEINRLFETTSEGKVFPMTAPNKVGDTKLDNKQVSEYQRDMGQRSRKLVEAYINSDLYKSSSDEARVEILNQLYSISRTITERDMFKKPVSDNSTYKRAISVYDKGGVSGLIDFLSKKTELDNAANIGPGDTTKIFNYVADKGGGMTQVNQWLTALGNDPIDQEKYDSLLDSREEEQRKAEFEKRYPEYNIKYVAASNGIDYLRNKGVTDIPQLGEMLYTAKKTPSKEETAVYDMGGYNALGLYYTMKADASGMNPSGSVNSLDEKEMAVYLRKNGYGYDDFNKWRAARGNDTPVDRSKYNKYINEGHKWTIPELKSQTAGSLSDFLRSYSK